MTLDTFLCHDCNMEYPVRRDGGTGYAREPGTWHYLCYQCCGKRDEAQMIRDGKATLYLNPGKVTNWPGTLAFVVNAGAIKRGHHNIAGSRYDVWFTGPDGAWWHGVTYGENTQLCHC